MNATFSATLATDDRLVDEATAADFLAVKPQTLAVWRTTGRYSLPFAKIGRTVRYRMSDLRAFVASRTVNNTGEADALDS